MIKMLSRLFGIDTLLQKLKSLSYWLPTSAAFLLLCGGLVLGALVERKEVAIALVFASTLMGTAILSLVLPKVLARVIGDEREKARILEEKLKAEKAEREAQEKLQEAEEEIKRLEQIQFNLQFFKPIANLGLLEVDMVIQDFIPKKLGPRETITRLGFEVGESQETYFGAAELPVKAYLGVDLQQVQIKVDPKDKDRLIVGGLAMSTRVDANHQPKWLLAEVRTEQFRKGEVSEIVINPRDARLMAQRDAHERQLRKDIRAGKSFKVFEKSVLQASREVITSLLAPLECKIVFEDSPPPGATPLMDFLAGEKQALANRIEQRHRALDAPRS
ncbi:MAG TPA: hypothetical protein PLT00_12680 [Verrucomicrobiota bacterium]|jgi:hypothetical protein|nr:MAG: hypothetical protein BWX84_00253 [Verrucomicrobia bacterium ADurb.Bin118]HPY31125.1 hypothetical protein [Verrucomicrobiota bacterium]HQB17557.1 hypothetical protein [Verrucomicrobiota bacterium]